MVDEELVRDRAKRLYKFVRGLIELRQVPVRKYAKEDTIKFMGMQSCPVRV